MVSGPMQIAPVRHNFPTVSDPAAMLEFPNARNNERDTLLEYVELRPGATVLDIQSAGGYLSNEVDRRLEGNGTILCVEPNAQLRSRLDPRYVAIDNPVEEFHSIADRTVDVALGLVGLHHSHSHRATIGESFRVLKPGGQLALCEVPFGSRLADWLNGFVARHCPSGHDGNFPVAGSISRICTEAGFVDFNRGIARCPVDLRSTSRNSAVFQGPFRARPGNRRNRPGAGRLFRDPGDTI